MSYRRLYLALMALCCAFPGISSADVPRAVTELLSRSATAAQTGNGQSDNGWGISDDGRLLIYRSAATDLVAGTTDDNATTDVFLYDRRAGSNELISGRHNEAQRSASGASFPLALSNDGRFVLFYSEAADVVPMVDANGGGFAGRDLVLRDRETGVVRLLTRKGGVPTLTSANAGLGMALMTADAAFVAFTSGATDIIPSISNPMSRTQVYVYTRADDSIRMLTTQAGNPAVASNGANPYLHKASADGQWWLFHVDATDLVSGVTTPIGWANLFLFGGDGNSRLLVSRQAGNPNAGCAAHVRRADMNGDATRIVFGSECPTHVSGVTDVNAKQDLFLFDRTSGTNSLISHAHGTTTQTSNGTSEFPKLTSLGDVVFRSDASDLVAPLVDGNGVLDVYLRSAGGAIELLSVSATGGVAGNAAAFSGLDPVSDDGRFVIMSSAASDLDGDVIDDNAASDVFVRDRVRARTELVSVRDSMPLRSGGGLSALGAATTPDGTMFVFGTAATELSAAHADVNGVQDAFVADIGALFADGFE